jgi:hypothetical protein
MKTLLTIVFISAIAFAVFEYKENEDLKRSKALLADEKKLNDRKLNNDIGVLINENTALKNENQYLVEKISGLTKSLSGGSRQVDLGAKSADRVTGIKIKGVNGIEAEFVALFDARPDGLMALVSPESVAITIPWAKIDIQHLKNLHPEVFKGYEKAIATQKDQPLGMGLAEGMMSLSQLPEALKQAVKDPYYWPYWNYSYQTVYTDSDGKTTTRTYVNTTTRYPYGYISPSGPYVILKKLRDVRDDRQKKELFASFKNGGMGSYGLDSMIERFDYVMSKIPPEKMFPRASKEVMLIQAAVEFRKVIQQMQLADFLTVDHQVSIKVFFGKIGVD